MILNTETELYMNHEISATITKYNYCFFFSIYMKFSTNLEISQLTAFVRLSVFLDSAFKILY